LLNCLHLLLDVGGQIINRTVKIMGAGLNLAGHCFPLVVCIVQNLPEIV
jgi:hypothetical protein